MLSEIDDFADLSPKERRKYLAVLLARAVFRWRDSHCETKFENSPKSLPAGLELVSDSRLTVCPENQTD